MAKYKGYSITDIKNIIFSKLIVNKNLIKALIISDTNFLETSLSEEQQKIINNPDILIRKQIFPYQRLNIKPEDNLVYITTRFYNFEKLSHTYQKGTIDFYVLVPISLEPTDNGSRYDYIIDMIDEIFSDNGIGKFEFYNRSDMSINDEYVGAVITYNITDFKLDD